MSNGFVFLRSYKEAVDFAPERLKGKIYQAIIDYGIEGIEPEITDEDSQIVAMAFRLVKPTIDSSTEKYEKNKQNGLKGGRPKTESKPNDNPTETQTKPNNNPTETQLKPKQNPTVTESKPNDNQEKEKEKDKELEKEKENKKTYAQTGNRFAEFWAAYPNKKSRKEAEKAYAKAIKTTSEQVILDALAKIIEQDWRFRPPKELQYIPYASTWLNQERWNDDITPTRSSMPSYWNTNPVREENQQLATPEEVADAKAFFSRNGVS